MITEQIITLRKQLKSKLEPMRFEHSVSVSFTCTALAMIFKRLSLPGSCTTVQSALPTAS